MTQRTQTAVETFAGPIYLVGALFIVTPIVDFLMNVWPLAIRTAEWRYGAAGLFSGFLLSPLLGTALVAWLALARGNGRVQRLAAACNLAVAVALVIVCADFVLDVAQIRGHISNQPEAQWAYYVGAAKALAKYLSAIVALFWLGRVGWRTRVHMGKGAEVDPLVVRASRAQAPDA